MRRAPLAEWLARLQQSLSQLQATAALAADAAGAQLLARLDSLRRELEGEAGLHSFGEWRRWLDWVLESESFIDNSVSSPLVLTSLPNARGRAFEAVAVLGADAAHLPGVPAPGLFNQSVHAALGLPAGAEHLAQLRDDLLALAVQGDTLFTWQAWDGDEPRPPSPFLTLLQTLHQAAWACGLNTQPAAIPPARAPVARLAAQVRRFGMKRRLVLLFACETRLPTMGRLPVIGQTRAMARSCEWGLLRKSVEL